MYIVKIDKIIQIDESKLITTKIYRSFMFHKSNSNYVELLEIYNIIEETLDNKD